MRPVHQSKTETAQLKTQNNPLQSEFVVQSILLSESICLRKYKNIPEF